MNLERARNDVGAIFQAVLRALEPAALVQGAIAFDGQSIRCGDTEFELSSAGRIMIMGVGKSAVGMAQGVEAVFGARLADGLVVTKHGLGARQPALHYTSVLEASHPVLDQSSISAGEALLQRADMLGEDDLVVMVLSGGGSALVEAPIDGVSLADFSRTTSLLLNRGADISTLNAVRRRLSRIKGGGLARAIAPARVVNIILSDVLGNSLNVIASGPTVSPDERDREQIARLRTQEAWHALPAPVRQALEAEPNSDPLTNVLVSVVVGDALVAAQAASAAAVERGYHSYVVGAGFSGEAREFAHFWSAVALATARGESSFAHPACLIGAGETTVTVNGDGIGGRNTEMATAAAILIDSSHGLAVASLATDGDDGISEATGGVVVGNSAAIVRDAGIDPDALLEHNDTRRFLEIAGGLIVTGQTGVNVNDLYIALID